MAQDVYEELKRKMLDYISHQREETTKEENNALEIKDPSMAVNCLDAVLGAFISLISMIPQLAGDPKTAEVIENGKAASQWLHENLDSLKNPEK